LQVEAFFRHPSGCALPERGKEGTTQAQASLTATYARLEAVMQIIPTRIHGMLDYLVGAILIVAPYLLGFANGGAAQWVPMIVGFAIIGMSLITDYELSIAKIVPMPLHLGADIATGLLLLASPWLFGFANRVLWPHVIIGLIEIGTALMTERHPRHGYTASRV
jgi:SPW repeat